MCRVKIILFCHLSKEPHCKLVIYSILVEFHIGKTQHPKTTFVFTFDLKIEYLEIYDVFFSMMTTIMVLLQINWMSRQLIIVF